MSVAAATRRLLAAFGRRRRRRLRRTLDVAAVVAAFRTEAAEAGRVRGLVWERVEACGPPVWAAERGRPVALIPVEIDFAADESGEMDDAPGLGLTRAATLLVRREGGVWKADVQPVFNLGPEAAAARLGLSPDEGG